MTDGNSGEIERSFPMITYQDVLDAQKRIAPYVLRTPLRRIPVLDGVVGGCEVYVKSAGLQYTGSFKLRGATNCLLALSDEQKRRGVVCASSGNHAQGVACAAQRLGIDAVIVMPENVNPVKLAGVKSFGGKALFCGTRSSERDAKVAELVREEGRTEVHPFANDFVRAGQGTLGLEILEDQPLMDAVVLPIGGGGLISGVATAVEAVRPSIRVIGVEPEGASRYRRSRREGRPVRLEQVDTIADGTRTDRADPVNFEMIERLVPELAAASDDAIRLAMKIYVSKAKIVAEPSSSLGLAAALEGRISFAKGEKVCFVVSGANNDLNLLAEVIQESN